MVQDGATEGAPAVTVVMPLLNGRATLAQQLDALAAQDFRGDWELVIADNGSTDGGPEMARAWSDRIPALRIVDASGAQGVSHARNVGAAAAEGDVIALADADDVASPSWVRAMAEASERFDMVGGRLDETSLNHEVIAYIRPPTQDEGLPIGLGFRPFSAGANFAVRAEVIAAIGGWSTTYRGGGDDIDFCWRGLAAGFTLGFAPEAVMAYRHREDLAALGRQFHHYGVMEVQLFRSYQNDGLSRSSTREGLRNWAWIAWHVRDLWGHDERRGVWLRKAGHRSGRLRGSLRYRRLYL